ncbi:Protein artichoke [Holothuria leucospilota]|uniref:Protein artichoke n=1 Tax=Holothuria leucospilota TaxID=206669 RepID=A0A9Q1BTF0_HOLLE|nr:Protein artichoke [Holothuria leucospilota]
MLITSSLSDACGTRGVCKCFLKSLKETVNCALQALTELPTGIPANVSTLDLQRNEIKKLDEESFQYMLILEKLSLFQNYLETLNTHLFSKTVMLQELDISFNQLKDLPDYLLRNTSGLKKFHLKRNFLVTLPSELFSQSIALEDLDISYNKLVELPEYLLRNNIKLIKLRLAGNKLTRFRKDFFLQLRNLQELDLSVNHITNMDVNFLSFSKMLWKFSLAGNKLTTLPSHLFSHSYGLEELDVSSNQLEYLPEHLLQNTTKLNVLLLHNNRIKRFGKDFFRQLKFLDELNLDHNQLSNMDLAILSPLKTLRFLRLENNDINYTSTAFVSGMTLLRKLYLRGNHIRILSAGSFVNIHYLRILDLTNNNMKIESTRVLSCLKNVETLFLSGNKIENIPEESFHSFYKMEILELNNNGVINIPDLLFSSMGMLQKLSMENNYLVEIRKSHFAALHNLMSLHLRWNRIRWIEKDSFQKLENLVELHLSHNNITCLPDDIFTGTPLLQQLDLSSNMIQEVHDGLFNNLSKLYILNMTGNAMTHLPEKIFSDSNDLVYLGLDDNHLQELPERLLKDLKDLRSLDLSLNELQILQSNTFDDIQEFIYLSVSFNNISKLPSDLFVHVALSSTLDLSNNRLTSLPSRLFNSHKKSHGLETLLLHRNQIDYLARDVFRGLPRLISLCLFYNNIKTLADDTFAGISGKIYLFGNELTIMNTTPFRNRNITEIHLYGNNIGFFKKTALRGLSSKAKVFIDCREVQKLQQSAVDLTCVTPQFVPVLLVDKDLGVVMGREGFTCQPTQAKSKNLCSPCPRGTFSNGQNECVPCPPGGYYQDEIGITNKQEICKKCGNGTFVRRGGGESIGDCAICPDGTNKEFHAGYRACFCLDKYARKERLGPCYLCLEKGVNCSGRDYESIQPGFYWSWNFEGANLTNYQNFVKNLEIESSLIDFNAKYDEEIPRPFACPRRESCKTTMGNIDVHCVTGYTGWLCSKCITGFYSVMNYCLPCPKKEWLFIEVALILCFCVVVSACLFRFHKLDKRRRKSERSLLDIFISRGKIALGFYQVVGEVFASLHDVSWATTMKFIGDVISFIELNILRLFIRPQCFHERLQINPKIEFVIAMIFIISVITGSFGIYQVLKTFHKHKTKYTDPSKSFEKYTKDLKSRLLTCSIITFFVTYPSVCTIVFQLYPRACESFCLDRAENTCKVLLRSDYDIECQDLNLYHIFAYAATAGYVVAYPAVLLFLLNRRFRFRLLKSAKIPQVSSDENVGNDQQILADGISCDGSNPVWVNFLCENYKPQYWYWEIVELTRKVTQTVLITLLGWENKLTVFITIGISVTYLTLHARYMPMKSVFEQRLQMFSLVAILFYVLIASMDVPDEYDDALSVAIVTLNSVIIIIIGAEVAFGLFVRLTHIRIHELAQRFSHSTFKCLGERSRSRND